MRTLHERWRDMMSASYGAAWQYELPTGQQADMKRAFMAGAHVFMVDWLTSDHDNNHVAQDERELDNFMQACSTDELTLQPWKA